MTTTIFTPIAEDKYAAAATVGVEVATIKPSGYLYLRAIVHPDNVSYVVAGLNDYYSQQNRPAPVILTREVGTTDWLVLDAPTVVIPDALPEDFS
jgi:hypothetical protein